MRVQARHLAARDRRRPHLGVIVCAVVLAMTAAMGTTGVVLLDRLRTFEAPFAPIVVQASANPAPSRADPATDVPADARRAVLAQDSPLTRARLAHLQDCRVPLPLAHMDTPELEDHARALLGCVDRGWRGALAPAGVQIAPVHVRVVAGSAPVRSSCGPLESAVPGAYCALDRTIYLSPELAAAHGEAPVWTEQRLVMVLAHEYSHHLQSATGILAAAERLRTHGADPDDVTRRLESQATCLATLTHAQLGGPQQVSRGFHDHMTDPDTYQADATHGDAATQAFWAERGYESGGQAQRCATFTAPAAQVS